jgi:hypothetical protein
VIGKEVPGGAGLRYVRKVGQDQICVVKVQTDKLTTKFENWIERNLLGINAWDITRLWIRDYVIRAMEGGLALVQRGDIRLEYNDAGQPRWKLLEDRKFVTDDRNPSGGRWKPIKMADDEELNIAKLNELNPALDDLKIVDVRPKPTGLSADLKVPGDFAKQDDAGVSALAEKGFFVAPLERNGPVELFSNDGEFRIMMKDGVEYVLRFGDIAGTGAMREGAKKSASGLNRYLLVMAQFDPSLIAKPALEPLPKTDEQAETSSAAEKKDAGKKEANQKPAQAEKERIEKDNKRKQDEYEQKIADGKKRVAQLNARFAGWYYVISDDVYRKIHLSRSDIVKKKEKKAEKGDEGKAEPADAAAKQPPAGIEGFEKLKEAGPAAK